MRTSVTKYNNSTVLRYVSPVLRITGATYHLQLILGIRYFSRPSTLHLWSKPQSEEGTTDHFWQEPTFQISTNESEPEFDLTLANHSAVWVIKFLHELKYANFEFNAKTTVIQFTNYFLVKSQRKCNRHNQNESILEIVGGRGFTNKASFGR